MPKSITIDTSGDIRHYRLKGDPPPICEHYGLWICNAISGNSAPYDAPAPRCFQFWCLSHLHAGKGWLWTPENGKQPYSAGEAVLIAPDQVHDFGGDGTHYVEDSICFTGSIADRLRVCGILQPGILRVGKVRRLQSIIAQCHEAGDSSQLHANLALQQLLLELHDARGREPESPYHDCLVALTQQVQEQPERWWTADDMAAFCNLSKNHFIRVFRSHTGLTPKRYADTWKMRHAAQHLTTTDDTLAEVSERFGFRDPFHFSRRFKTIIGLSPDTYRRQVPMGPTPGAKP